MDVVRFEKLRILHTSLRRPRPPETTFQDQIRDLAKVLVGKNWDLYARTFDSKPQLKWSRQGKWFDDASGIAEMMIEARVKLIQFQHVPSEQLIVDFFSSLSRGTVMHRPEIGIVSGVEESSSTPIDWAAEIAKLPPREKITWEEALQAASNEAAAVLKDDKATAEQLRRAFLRLQVLQTPAIMDPGLKRLFPPQEIEATLDALRKRHPLYIEHRLSLLFILQNRGPLK